MKAIDTVKEWLGLDQDAAAIEQHLQGAARETDALVARDLELDAQLKALELLQTQAEGIACMLAQVDRTRAEVLAAPKEGQDTHRDLQHRVTNVLKPVFRRLRPGQSWKEEPGPPNFSLLTAWEQNCWLRPDALKAELTAAILEAVPADSILTEHERTTLSIPEQAERIAQWRSREQQRLLEAKAAVGSAHERARRAASALKERLQRLIDPLPAAAKREHDEAVAATDAARDVERQKLERQVNTQVGKR